MRSESTANHTRRADKSPKHQRIQQRRPANPQRPQILPASLYLQGRLHQFRDRSWIGPTRYHAPYVLSAGRVGLLCMGTDQDLSRLGSAPPHDIRTAELHAFMHHLIKPQHSLVAKCRTAMQSNNPFENPMCTRIVIQAMGRRHAGMAV